MQLIWYVALMNGRMRKYREKETRGERETKERKTKKRETRERRGKERREGGGGREGERKCVCVSEKMRE